MTQLGPEARALLSAAREGLGPDHAAIVRLHARISAAVIAPAPRPLPAPPVRAAHALEAERPRPGPSSPAPGPSLAREVELLDVAGAALRTTRYADAIDAIASYTRETAGHGQLAEEAAAIEVEASCKLGAPDAAAHLDDFDHRWPHSGERARLAAACAAR
jgi:hypothetical protein